MRRLTRWLTSEWSSTWARHRSVFALWLIGLLSFAASIGALIIDGYDAAAPYGFLLVSLTLTSIHESVVRVYGRRDERASP